MNEDLNLSELDDTQSSAIEDIFTLPDSLQDDPRISRWYQEMIANLRSEAQGIPMQTNQFFLMERIAYLYALIRYREFSDVAYPGREHREDLKVLSGYMDQFNKLLEKHNDKVVNEMLMQVMNILTEALPLISDSTERAALRRRLQEDFANINL